jgi:hypothetical protein
MNTDNKHQVNYTKQGYTQYRGYTIFQSSTEDGTLVAEKHSHVFAKNLKKMIDKIDRANAAESNT